MAPLIKLLAGVAATALLASMAYRLVRSPLLSDLGSRTATVMAANGITDGRAAWTDAEGWTWRIARLSGTADPATRARTLAEVAALPGVGATLWEELPAETPAAAADPGRASIAACQARIAAIIAAQPIVFPLGSSVPTAAAQPVLDAVAGALRSCVGNRVTITGHTRNTGAGASNLALSQLRADAIAAALVDRGIDRRLLEAIGNGEGAADTPAHAIDIRISKGPAGLRVEETS